MGKKDWEEFVYHNINAGSLYYTLAVLFGMFNNKAFLVSISIHMFLLNYSIYYSSGKVNTTIMFNYFYWYIFLKCIGSQL